MEPLRRELDIPNLSYPSGGLGLLNFNLNMHHDTWSCVRGPCPQVLLSYGASIGDPRRSSSPFFAGSITAVLASGSGGEVRWGGTHFLCMWC